MDFIVISIGEAVDGGFPVTCRTPAGAATLLGWIPEELVVPVGGNDLEVWIRKRLVRRNDYGDIGDLLATLLKDGSWPADLLRCAGCGTGRAGVHLEVVFDIAPQRLRELPWEMLRNRGEFVFKGRGHQCVRASGSPEGLVPPAHHTLPTLPIKVLILVGSFTDRIYAEPEIRSVYRAVKKYPDIWQVKVMHTPEKAVVEAEIDASAPHVFHVIGHSQDGRGLTVDAPDRWLLGPDAIATLYRNGRPRPRLFLLNICDSSRMVAELQDGRDRGGSVIAMQADIRGKAACRFTEGLYARLIAGEDISQAVYHGRDTLLGLGAEESEWPLPVLDVAPACNAVMQGHADLNRRWQLFSTRGRPSLGRFSELMTLSKGHPLTGVSGEKESGKSYLVRKYLTQCQVLGELAVCLDLGTEKTWAPREALAAAAAAVLQQVRGQYAREHKDSAAVGTVLPALNQVDELRADLDSRLSTIAVDEAYDRFVGCLDAIAELAGRGLVFAFDGIDRIMSGTQRFDELMLHHSQISGAGPSRLIAVARTGAADTGLTDLADWERRGVPTVQLGTFPVEEYIDIGREVCRRYDVEDDELLPLFKRMQQTRMPLLPETALAFVRKVFPVEDD